MTSTCNAFLVRGGIGEAPAQPGPPHAAKHDRQPPRRPASQATGFRLEDQPIPQPEAGQLLLRTLYLSLDPYMRGRMSEGPSYATPVAIGEVMVGGTVSRVEVSHHSGFKAGQLVQGYAGWQDYALSDGQSLTALYPDAPHPSRALGVLGMPGFTAYMGLLDIGKPVAGETVVVAAASGPVGAAVGQIAKIKGCHVIDELGFDFCVDHRAPDLPGHLTAACPQGIDVYFENVVQGGQVKVREDIVFGLLQGKNFGKLVIQIAHE